MPMTLPIVTVVDNIALLSIDFSMILESLVNEKEGSEETLRMVFESKREIKRDIRAFRLVYWDSLCKAVGHVD